MKRIKKIIGLIVVLALSSCVTESDLDQSLIDPNPPALELLAPSDFDFETSKLITARFDVPEFLSGAVFRLAEIPEGRDSIVFARGTFNDSGSFEKKYSVQKQSDTILLLSDFIGLPHEVKVPIIDDIAEYDFYTLFYETNNSSGKASKTILPSNKQSNLISGKLAVTYSYLGGFDANGVPDYLVESDQINKNFLRDINGVMPSNKNAPTYHPEYFDNNQTSLVLKEAGDVWVTYVAESTDWRNSLGYYSYPVGNPPQNQDEIDEHFVIFPHTSMVGSGGKLKPGYKVYLGYFPANTVISWFLSANLWYGSFVGQPGVIHYSQPGIATNIGSNLPQQIISFYDGATNRAIFSFEDYPRFWWSDEDFNDVIFYASTNPASAIDTAGMVSINAASDTDGDGVADEQDEYPNDIHQAFNNYTPAENNPGKLVFEDLWPSMGDYDFNDLALEYRYNLITNANNLVVKMEAEFVIKELGGSFKNGFGFVLPISKDKVRGIENQVLNAGYMVLNPNGTESNTSENETVVLVVGDVYNMLGETININVEFTEPMLQEDLGQTPYDLFLIVNGDRAREVHLPDHAPTSKAAYLGDSNDDSDPLGNRYYKTSANDPWALHIFDEFQPPAEKVPIYDRYPKFKNWAKSGGKQDLDWYKNN